MSMRQASSSSITPRFLVALLDGHGAASDDVLAAAGVSRADLDSPDLRMPWRELAELWRRAAQHVPEVGLVLNGHFPAGQMHVITHIALRSDTVGAALSASCACLSHLSPMERLHLQAEGETTALVYHCEHAVSEIPWLTEHYFALMRALLSRALGRALPLAAVQLRAAPGAPLASYVATFGVTPQFLAARNAVLVDTATLQWPLQTRDAYLREILERVIARNGVHAPLQGWVDRARASLTGTLLQGRTPTIGATADALSITVSALRDRLGAEGQTFRTLLDATRRDLAREHLGRGMSASEVAYLLGFSEPAGFQHACRRWFGVAAGAVHRLPLPSPGDTGNTEQPAAGTPRRTTAA
jgi:AraC-like DNA-binding protein